MLDRFKGDDGARRLRDAIKSQRMVGGNEALAAALASVADVTQRKASEVLIRQTDSSNSLFLILSGRVAITVNGRGVATREGGEHVGEMALIDPAEPRSASVTVVDDAVVAEIQEPAFTQIVNDFPFVWRSLASGLSHRLRERGAKIRQPNEKPRLFLGSTVEALAVVREIQAGLDHDKVVSVVWTDRVFGASSFSIDSLEAQVQSADFAVMAFTPDDLTLSRDKLSDAPRDNVVFELGLFMGALGRARTFIVRPRGVDLKIPSDLLGLTTLEYAAGTPEDLPARLGATCNELRKAIARLGAR